MELWKIKPVLLKHKEKPMLMIRITLKRKVCYIKTPYVVTEKQIDKDGKIILHKNAGKINLALNKERARVEDKLTTLHLAGTPITTRLLKNILKGKSESVNVFHFIEEVNQGGPGKTRNWRKEAKRLKEFAGSSLEFSHIDSRFIRRYEAHERGRNMSQNTLNSTFKWLRRVLNLAVKEGLIKTSPLVKEDVPKYHQSERIYLVKEEREALVKFWKDQEVDGSLYISLTYFLLGVYSGLRHQDWKQALSRVSGELMNLRTTKTKEWVTIPIGPTLKEILEVVKTLPPPFSAEKTRGHLKIIMGQMKLKKNITTHSARHSFGTMCAEIGLSKSTTSSLLGVNERTVEVYYHLTGINIMEQAAALKSI